MSNNLGPISVSKKGLSVNIAGNEDIIFNTRYPFAKIDTTNPVSFQIINIAFFNEPPRPALDSGLNVKTLIYKYAHGYDYIPSTYFLISKNNFQEVLGAEGSLIAGNYTAFGQYAAFEVEVDATYIYFYVNVYDIGIFDSYVTVAGTNLSIRAYVFVNDLSGTDVPTQS